MYVARCARCGGQLFRDRREPEADAACLQCGWRLYMADADEPESAVRARWQAEARAAMRSHGREHGEGGR